MAGVAAVAGVAAMCGERRRLPAIERVNEGGRGSEGADIRRLVIRDRRDVRFDRRRKKRHSRTGEDEELFTPAHDGALTNGRTARLRQFGPAEAKKPPHTSLPTHPSHSGA